MHAWCFEYVYGFNGKMGFNSVRIIRLLGIISIQTKSFCLVAQHQWVYESENLYTVLWDWSDFNNTREFMQSGYPDYQPLSTFVQSEMMQKTKQLSYLIILCTYFTG